MLLATETFAIPLDSRSEPQVASSEPAATSAPDIDREATNARYLIYAPLKKVAFVTNAAGLEAVQDLQQGRIPTGDPGLIDFLNGLKMLDGESDSQPIDRFEGAPQPTSVTLFLTTGCNLRCSYCWAAAGDTPKHMMPLDVAQSGIDFVVSNAVQRGSESIEVVFHGGGEPTVNWKTLTGAWRYAKRRADEEGLILRSSLTTNGVLSKSRAKWIVEHLDCVNVSFDGAPDMHDAHRLTEDGQPSSQFVERTLRLLDRSNVLYGVRITVTSDQTPRLARSVRYICERFSPAKIHIEPAFPLGRWKEAPSAETAEFISAYRAARQVAQQFNQQLYFSGANTDKTSAHFCGVTQDGFSLTHNGKVSACYEVFLDTLPQAARFIYGATKQGELQYDVERLEHLRDQTVDKRDFCQGCFAKWSCSGDCLHRALSAGDEFQGSDRCHIIRELTKDQILEKIAADGGSVWRGAAVEKLDSSRLQHAKEATQ